MTIRLNQILTNPTTNFLELMASGHISERSHELDESLRVYSYTPKTQFSGFWTEETRLARGLMLRVNEEDFGASEVLGRGLPKFFTVEQLDSDWSHTKLVDDDEGVTVEDHAELNWDGEALVANKLNGALGLAYVAPDGVAVSTRGSFASTEALIATRVMRSHVVTLEDQREFAELSEGVTFLFEIITPEREHPVDYGDFEGIVLLGSVRHSDGYWTPAREDDFIARRFGFLTAEILPLRSLREAVTAPYVENTEGYVVTINDERGQHMYKVKGSEYAALRKLFYATEALDLGELLLAYSSEELESLRVEDITLPSALRNVESRRAMIQSEVLEPLARELRELRAGYREIRGEGALPERGEFARKVKSSSQEISLMFKCYDEEMSGRKSLAKSVLTRILKKKNK